MGRREYTKVVTCWRCNGQGKLDRGGSTCSGCGGTGQMTVNTIETTKD